MATNRAGSVYRCTVCGAELSVIRSGEGRLAPVCCNVPMVRIGVLRDIYVCPVCGIEVMVVRKGGGSFEPICCSRPMVLKSGDAERLAG